MFFLRTLSKLFIAVCLTATVSCITRFEKETPGEGYPNLKEGMIGDCPDISGIYTDGGHFTCSADAVTCQLPSRTYGTRGQYEHSEGYWVGSSSLTHNLTDISLIDIQSIGPTELIQPNENTLIVAQGDFRRTLRQEEGDFECGPDGLVISSGLHSGMPIFALIGLTWIVDFYTQTFKPHEDGSLTMTVRQFSEGFHVFIGYVVDTYYFVHWLPTDAHDNKMERNGLGQNDSGSNKEPIGPIPEGNPPPYSVIPAVVNP
jgi:hypothetical protein